MTIKGIEGLSSSQLLNQIKDGAKFVVFQYCISIIIITFKRHSKIYFIPAGESAFGKGLGFTLISLLFGWWGIPWGPIYTIQSAAVNFQGGKDITQDVLISLQRAAQSTGA
ncbi:MAG: hypothetical protein OEZ02_05055 [Anaerolineae bacterium]|nr:hypothetical protein [Anaerolineae bacterium]